MDLQSSPSESTRAKDVRWLRWSVAFLWLATGLGVFHQHYREVGHDYLERLHLADEIMYATCVAEIALALRVAFGRPATWITVLQIALIIGFT